jgi:GNAT superfamily N-acetyltransferase
MDQTSQTSDAGPTIRRAGVADAGLLASIGARLFEQSFGAANDPDDMRIYLSSAFSPRKQEGEIADPTRIAWIAVDGAGEAIGYAMVKRGGAGPGVVASRPAEVQRIYADRAWHGRGTGAALMRTCIAQAVDWDCDVMWLGVWEQNPRAIAFYEKVGFRAVGRQTFVLGRDVQYDVVMALHL